MIKLAAIDLDGTLFDPDQKITPVNKQAIRKAIDSGIKVAIVTGRGRIGAERALDQLGMDLPYICSAGALAREGRQGAALYAHAFHRPKEIAHLLAFARLSGAGLITDTPEDISYWFGPDAMEELVDPATAADTRQSLRSRDPERDFDRPLLKMTIVAEADVLLQAEKLVREKCPSIHQTYSGLKYIDLTGQGVNKGTALKALAELWKLRSGEVAAIGDQAIDVFMLKYAGLPIAMGNAVDELKRAAKWIAPGNDQDGVAWALEKMIEQNKGEKEKGSE